MDRELDIREMLFWYDYENGEGPIPICVSNPSALKEFVEWWEKHQNTTVKNRGYQ